MIKAKTPSDRVQFYLRKANEYSAARFDWIRGRRGKKPNGRRFMRLMAYQDEIRRRADEWRRDAM